MPHCNTMLPIESMLKTVTDQDGDVVMSNTQASNSAISPFKERFNFDWFSFDGKKSSRGSSATTATSPSTDPRVLSVSTVSPTSYFVDSPAISDPYSGTTLNVNSPGLVRVACPSPPPKPLRWIWQCHLCHCRYPLAVTRRCLVDGHYYCSGNTQAQRNTKKRRRQQSCTSEFDYVAWKEWGQWRRKVLTLLAFANGNTEPELLGCEGCCSPSQCRYENRRPVEVLKFNDFVEEADLILDDVEIKSLTKTLPGDQPCPPSNVAKEGKIVKGRRVTTKNDLRIDADRTSPFHHNCSKRHRFYSNFAGNSASKDVSPTSESSSPTDKSKFDFTPPPVPISAAKTAGNGDDELTAIESTLKAALASQRQSPLSPRFPENPAASSTARKRRVNSKIGDPQFEITPDDGQVHFESGDPVKRLQRTYSQQSLLTDFFKQRRNIAGDDSRKRDAVRRAASEADIAAFLSQNVGRDLDERKPRNQRQRSVHAYNGRHFEDVNLAPAKTTSFREALLSGVVENESGESSKRHLDTAETQGQQGGESSRLGVGFGFPSFVFGKK